MASKLVLLGLFVLAALLIAFNRNPGKKKVIFFGDSITELGVRPGGYISVMHSLNAELARPFELIGSGKSGDKVYDLYLRMDADVLSRQPALVVIYIGVNDVWHKQLLGTGTDYDKFGKFYQAIVQKLQAAGIGVIFCTPAVIGEKTGGGNPMDKELDRYADWIRQFAAGKGLALADLRKIFTEHNARHNSQNADRGILTTDGVHLNEAGNQLVGAEVWKLVQAAATR